MTDKRLAAAGHPAGAGFDAGRLAPEDRPLDASPTTSPQVTAAGRRPRPAGLPRGPRPAAAEAPARPPRAPGQGSAAPAPTARSRGQGAAPSAAPASRRCRPRLRPRPGIGSQPIRAAARRTTCPSRRRPPAARARPAAAAPRARAARTPRWCRLRSPRTRRCLARTTRRRGGDRLAAEQRRRTRPAAGHRRAAAAVAGLRGEGAAALEKLLRAGARTPGLPAPARARRVRGPGRRAAATCRTKSWPWPSRRCGGRMSTPPVGPRPAPRALRAPPAAHGAGRAGVPQAACPLFAGHSGEGPREGRREGPQVHPRRRPTQPGDVDPPRGRLRRLGLLHRDGRGRGRARAADGAASGGLRPQVRGGAHVPRPASAGARGPRRRGMLGRGGGIGHGRALGLPGRGRARRPHHPRAGRDLRRDAARCRAIPVSATVRAESPLQAAADPPARPAHAHGEPRRSSRSSSTRATASAPWRAT